MSHPHTAMFKEFEIAIRKLPPTLPELQVKGKAMLKALESDESVTEDGILDALAEIGREEYPHRHALLDVHHTYGEGMEASLVLEHVDPNVAKKIQPMMKHGVTMEELMRSDWFEGELSPEERYQVEDGVMLAHYKLEQEDKGLIALHQAEFEKRVAYWEEQAKEIETMLDTLEDLAKKDVRYKEEIQNQVRMFRSGFSVAERDPNPADVRAALDYWQEVLNPDSV